MLCSEYLALALLAEGLALLTLVFAAIGKCTALKDLNLDDCEELQSLPESESYMWTLRSSAMRTFRNNDLWFRSHRTVQGPGESQSYVLL